MNENYTPLSNDEIFSNSTLPFFFSRVLDIFFLDVFACGGMGDVKDGPSRLHRHNPRIRYHRSEAVANKENL